MTPFRSNRDLTVLILYALMIIGIVLFADVGGASGVGTEYLNIIHAVPAGDKWGHFLLFGGLSFLANMVLAGRLKSARTPTIRKHVILSTVILAIVWLEEFSQNYIPNRNFDLLDMLADGAGVFIFASLAVVWSARRKQQVTRLRRL